MDEPVYAAYALPRTVNCGVCDREVSIQRTEQRTGILNCPACEKQTAAILSPTVSCPICMADIGLSDEQRRGDLFQCSQCKPSNRVGYYIRGGVIPRAVGEEQQPSAPLPVVREQQRESHGSANDLWIGFACIAIGLLFTLVTYSEASSGAGGGRYIIAFGPVIYGIRRLVRGLG